MLVSLVTSEILGLANISAQHDSMLIAGLPVIEMRFENGEEKLRHLEKGLFIGSGRIIAEQGRPLMVEYKLGKVAHG